MNFIELDFVKKNWRYILIGIIISIIIYLLINDSKEENFESEIKNEKHIILFYAPWCPHCKNLLTADGSWTNLEKRYRTKKNIVITKIDCDKNPDIGKKYGIEGYPTILKINNNKVTEYTGDRSLESLEKFVN